MPRQISLPFSLPEATSPPGPRPPRTCTICRADLRRDEPVVVIRKLTSCPRCRRQLRQRHPPKAPALRLIAMLEEQYGATSIQRMLENELASTGDR
jgi:hypothetical protein